MKNAKVASKHTFLNLIMLGIIYNELIINRKEVIYHNHRQGLIMNVSIAYTWYQNGGFSRQNATREYSVRDDDLMLL